MFKKEANRSNGKVDTLIGPGTTIEGKVQATGILRVEGRIGGEVMSDGDVIVGEKGEIRANIKARHVTIAGKVIGNVTATGRMHLVASGSLTGDIEAAKIIIEEGAHFKGACRMTDSPTGKGRSSVSETHLETEKAEPVTSGTTAYHQTTTTDKNENIRPLADVPQW